MVGAEPMAVTCRTCGKREVSPSNVRARIPHCWKCRLPKIAAIKTRYMQSDKGHRFRARHNARRVLVGRRYLGRVPTGEHAAVVNAHIRRRVSELKSRQSARAKAEGI